MQLISQIESVFKVVKNQSQVIVGKHSAAPKNSIITGGDELLSLKRSSLNSLIKEQVYTIMPFKDGVIYSEKNGAAVKFRNSNSTSVLIDSIEGKVFFNSNQERSFDDGFVFRTKVQGQKKHFVFFQDFTILEAPLSFKLIYGKYYLDWELPGVIRIYTLCEGKFRTLWEDNICKYGEIDERNALFCSNETIFIPIKGGLLLALNIKDGNCLWLRDENIETYCSYSYGVDSIYQNYGRGALSINPLNGRTIQEFDFNQNLKPISFQASGPIWCFDEIIVLIDSVDGKVVVLDYNFELVGHYEIGKPGIANSKDKIVYSSGCLYVLGMDNTLYVFEINN